MANGVLDDTQQDRGDTIQATYKEFSSVRRLLARAEQDLATNREALDTILGDVEGKSIELQHLERHNQALENEITRCHDREAVLTRAMERHQAESSAQQCEVSQYLARIAELEAENAKWREDVARLGREVDGFRGFADERATEIGELRALLAAMALANDNALQAWEAQEKEIKQQRRLVAELRPKEQSNKAATAALAHVQMANADLRERNAGFAQVNSRQCAEIEHHSAVIAELENRSRWSKLRWAFGAKAP